MLAPDLLGESLALQLTRRQSDWEVSLRPDALNGHPQIVIWSIDKLPSLSALQREVLLLQERWHPAPLLLLLPVSVEASRDQLLTLGAEGLLQNGDCSQLQEAIDTLLQGGRTVRLQTVAPPSEPPSLGLAQSLLLSGLQQISNDLQVIEALLKPPPQSWLLCLLLEGRCRELRSARALLLWLWGPLQVGLEDAVPLRVPMQPFTSAGESTAITLRQRNALAVWESIRERLDGSVPVSYTHLRAHET